MCTSCPRKEGIPCRPPLAIQKLSLELAHNLPHSLGQEWYSGLISSLICYASGCVHLGFRDDPRGCRAGVSGLLSGDRVLVWCLCACR